VAIGAALGFIGVRLTRWESGLRSLHYTPNQWLVLAITLIVAARVVYGMWRGWTWWGTGGNAGSFADAFGIAGTLGAGAVVLGYYLAYSVGVRRRIRQWEARSLRVMDSRSG
jgi:hypothetical protein